MIHKIEPSESYQSFWRRVQAAIAERRKCHTRRCAACKHDCDLTYDAGRAGDRLEWDCPGCGARQVMVVF